MAIKINGKTVAGAGAPAKINGINTLNITAGENINIQQDGANMTISAAGGFKADGSVPMSGDLNLDGHTISNVGAPVQSGDAVNKDYVDDVITEHNSSADAHQSQFDAKQDKLTGQSGQVVGFDSGGNAVAQAAPSGLPSGGSNGQILGYDASGPAWVAPPAVYSVGAAAPADTRLLWIDTNSTTGGLKYYNGSAWAHVPVAYT